MDKRFTNREKRDELAREINWRRVNYPGQVRTGRLRQGVADRQLALLTEVWMEYDARTRAEKSGQPADDEGAANTGKEDGNDQKSAPSGNDQSWPPHPLVMGVDLAAEGSSDRTTYARRDLRPGQSGETQHEDVVRPDDEQKPDETPQNVAHENSTPPVNEEQKPAS